MNSRKREGELWNRLQEIFKLLKLDYLEEHQRDIIQRLITKYQKHREYSLQETEKLVRKGIIRESQSPFNSPLWIVPKQGNKIRMVIDYRKFNEDMDQAAYPLPVIDDILDQLGRAKLFLAFDLSAGFHQIPMKDSDKKYTAFSTSQ